MRSFWNIISAIAGVLAVAITVFVFFQARSEQRKTLEIELIARSTLVDEKVSRPGERFEVIYDGRTIYNYVILQLRVANIGGQPIRSSDYEDPIQLKFDNVIEILSTEQLSSDPKALQVNAQVNGQSVELSKALLNPSDWFILEVGVVPMKGRMPMVEPRGRIAGVKKIEFKESLSPPTGKGKFSAWLLALMLFQAGFVLILIMMIFGRFRMRNRSPDGA